MTLALWIVVFVNVLCGAFTWPLPSSHGPHVSVYDMCTKTDLYQIEELQRNLRENLNRSSAYRGEDVSSLSFGLLDQDWKRLEMLEKRIPEGSELKSKLLVVFRVLIAALYQAHGRISDQLHGRQDNHDNDYDDRNKVDYEEYDAPGELDTGESQNVNVLDNGTSFNIESTTVKNVVSNEEYGSSYSFGEDFDDSQAVDLSDSKDLPGPYDLPPTTLTQLETENKHNLLIENIQINEPVHAGTEKSRTFSDENSDSSWFSSTSVTETSTTGLILDLTASPESDKSKTVTTKTVKSGENDNKDVTEEIEATESQTRAGDYEEEKNNAGTSESSNLQKNISEHISTMDHSTSTIRTFINSTTSSFINYTTTTDVFPTSLEEDFEKTKSFSDTPRSFVYPEMIALQMANERINNEKNISLESRKDTSGSFTAAMGSWEKNRISEDLDGSDSIVNQVIVPFTIKESEQTKTPESDEVEERQESVSDGAHYVTKSNKSNWNLNRSNTPESFKMSDASYESSTNTPSDYRENHRDVMVTILPRGAKTTHNAQENQAHTNTYMDDDVGAEKESNEDHLGLIQSKEDFTQDELEDKDDYKPLITPNLDSTYVTQISIAENLNLRENDKKSNTTQTFKAPDANSLLPLDNSFTSIKNKTSIMKEQDFEVSPYSESKTSRPVDTKYNIPESFQDVDESFEPHFTDEKQENRQSSIEEKSFVSPTNDENSNPSVNIHIESLEDISKAVNDELQSSREEQSALIPKNNYSPVEFIPEPKSTSRVRNDGFPNTNQDKDVLYSRNTENDSSPRSLVSESLEHISSAEHESLPEGANEKDGTWTRNDENAAEFIAPSTKPEASSENANLQSSTEDIDVISSKMYKGSDPDQSGIPESSDQISRGENYRLQTSAEEKYDQRSRNDDGVVPDADVSHESSEHISSVENVNFQSESDEKIFLSPTIDRETNLAEKPFPENSEDISREENGNYQSNLRKEDHISSKIYDKISDEKAIPGTSERISSAKSEISRNSSTERNILNPTDTGHLNPALHFIPDISEDIVSAESGKVFTSYELKGLGEDSEEDKTKSETYPYLLGGSNMKVTDDSENRSSDFHKSEFKPGITKSPQPEEKASTDADEEEESFRTSNLFLPQSIHSSSPAHIPNDLKIYSAHQYPYEPSNLPFKSDCRNGNDCVRVQHIEYKSSDSPSPAKLKKRFSSKFKSKQMDSFETNDDMSMTYSDLEQEYEIWQDKLRHLKESLERDNL